MQGWVDLVGWLHTEMVYPPEDGHPSKSQPGPTCVNFVQATHSANHYATPPDLGCGTYQWLSVTIPWWRLGRGRTACARSTTAGCRCAERSTTGCRDTSRSRSVGQSHDIGHSSPPCAHSRTRVLQPPPDDRQKKIAHTRLPSVGFRSWSRFFPVSLHVMWVINPAVGCHYFPPGLQLPPQPLRGLLPILLLGEQRHNGCEQFA